MKRSSIGDFYHSLILLNDGAQISIVDTKTKRAETYSLKDGDEVSVVKNYFQSKGVLENFNFLPTVAKAGFFQKLSSATKLIFSFLGSSSPWKFYWSEAINDERHYEAITFDRQLSQNIKKSAANKNVQTKSFLLHSFHEISAPYLQDHKSRWLTPVHLTKPPKEDDLYQTSFSEVTLTTSTNLTSLDATLLSNKLIEKAWGLKFILKFLKIGGKSFRGWLLKKLKSFGPKTGTFYYWGELSGNKSKDLGYIVAPVYEFSPVSLSCYEKNDEFLVALNFHPKFKISTEEIRQILETWKVYLGTFKV